MIGSCHILLGLGFIAFATKELFIKFYQFLHKTHKKGDIYILHVASIAMKYYV